MNKKEQKKQLSAPKWLSHIHTQKKKGGKYTIKKSREKREKKRGEKRRSTHSVEITVSAKIMRVCIFRFLLAS